MADDAHGSIKLNRKDLARHDLSTLPKDVLAGFSEAALRESESEERGAAAAAAGAAPGSSPPSSVIRLGRSDGLHHDIIKLARDLSSDQSLKADADCLGSGSGSATGATAGAGSLAAGLSGMIIADLAPAIRIVHFGDTHNRLLPLKKGAKIESALYPAAQILIHSGNFTLSGSLEEHVAFNSWLASVSPLYPVRIVILGSKDVKQLGTQWAKYREVLSAATHVLINEQATVLGIKVYGAGWVPGIKSNNTLRPGAPASTSLKYDAIPAGIDVLVTHGPRHGVLDKVGGVREHWGSQELGEAIRRVQPGLHLHGHIKEGRGFSAAFNKDPLSVNSCMTDTDKADCVLYAAPHVIAATPVGGSSSKLTSSSGPKGFHFHLAPLVN